MKARCMFFTKFVRKGAALWSLLFLFANCGLPSHAYKWVTYDEDGTKHIHAPFVNIGVKKHADGTKDVDVKAPFTNVHNPAGEDNTKVHAPFTDIEPKQTNKLPKPSLQNPASSNSTNVPNSPTQQTVKSKTKPSSSTKSSSSNKKNPTATRQPKASPET